MNLNGGKCDVNKLHLVQKIIDIIAKVGPNKTFIREVNQLTHILKCEKMSNEPVKKFVNRFDGAITRYVNKTGMTEDTISRQLLSMMMQSVGLTYETLNLIAFQLSTVKHNSPNNATSQKITLNHPNLVASIEILCLVWKTKP